MSPINYAISVVIIPGFAGIVFRGLVRRQYLRHGRLRWWATLAEVFVFSVWTLFGYLQIPAAWPHSDVHWGFQTMGWILFAGGVFITLLAGINLGAAASFGAELPILRTSGLYSVVRNPQSTAFGVALIGHMLVWPTWRLCGAIFLYYPIVHLMILGEEEHLTRALGEEYRDYRQRVPRYLPVKIRSRLFRGNGNQ